MVQIRVRRKDRGAVVPDERDRRVPVPEPPVGRETPVRRGEIRGGRAAVPTEPGRRSAPVGREARRRRGAAWWEKPLLALVPLALLVLFGLLIAENCGRPAATGSVADVAGTPAAPAGGPDSLATPSGAPSAGTPSANPQSGPAGPDAGTGPPATGQAGATPTGATGVQAGTATPTTAQAGSATALPSLAVEEVITGLPLGQPERLAALAGRPVRLTNVKVQEVVGDQTFWIGPTPTQRILVFLREDKRPGQAAEGGVEVEVGQVANLNGAIRRLPSADEIAKEWSLDPQALEAVQQEQVYIHVDDVRDFRIVSQP